MKYVVDASVGLKWLLTEVDSDRARQLRDDYRADTHELLAPELFTAEIGALLMAERLGEQRAPTVSVRDRPLVVAVVCGTPTGAR